MAEYSQAGLLAALLLFTALTARDVLPRQIEPASRTTTGQRPQPLPGYRTTGHRTRKTRQVLPVHRARTQVPVLYLLRVQQSVPGVLTSHQPTVPGHPYRGRKLPPNPLQQVSSDIRCFGNLVSYLKLLSILLIVSGQNPFILLGLDTPRAWTWSQDNKIFSCLMAFFLCNMMETHFLSTGAFEVTLNDVPLWSKLQSGYVPNIQEIFQILDNHLKMNQVDPMSFTST
ncbi:Selenoprotein T2 [Nibea albiflora]|uniref:Selenoprotein T2 n=1 Tax=Nibea albiflora TaxID=240163 RepID=A0ACB7EU78_NIBAL|nr:Selenoprotein T2 [Nibea albiflora]